MVNYSTSFVHFLQTSKSRIAKILYRAHVNWYMYGRKYKDLITTDKVNYITFRKDGTISFLPAGKEHKENDDGEWARDGRQNGKPGKVIQKLFTDKMLRAIPPKEFETFSNAYKAAYNSDGYTFTLYDNKKIPHVYSMTRRPGGRLGDSCMNDDTDYLDIYKYCDSLKILALKDEEGRLCGRALVWFLEHGFTVMDRIYTSDDFLDDMFLDYARDNGWHRKQHYKTYDYRRNFVSPEGVTVCKDLVVKTDVNHDYYPYIDTFCYGDESSLNNYGDGPYTYNCTDGRREPHEEDDDHEDESYDDIDDCYISQDDAVQIDRGDRRGCWTHRDNTVEVNGHTYWERASQIVHLSYDNEWYLTEDVVFCEKDQEDYPESECVYTKSGWILRDEAVEIDGEWYHKDDSVYSQYHREDLVKDDAVFSKFHNSWIKEDEAEEINGDWYHKDEIPEELQEEKELAYVDRDDRLITTNDPNQIKLPF